MRLVKLILFAALVVGWWQLWHVRDSVTAAYTTERPTLALELDGVGVVLAASERPVSPYALQPAGMDRSPTFLSIASAAEPQESSPVDVTGGQATLSGTVTLPDGTPVAGATVRIERFTSEGQGTAETVSGPDGSWSAAGLQGGRLRVRAFAPNQLASVESVVLVVSRIGSERLSLLVEEAATGLRFEMFGPPGIAYGTAGTAAIVISSEVVDEAGRLIQMPVVGRETTTAISGGRLLSADVVVTDPGGAVRYFIACDVEGTPIANITTGDEASVIGLPACMSAESLAELEAVAAAERAAEQEVSQAELGFAR